MFDEILSEIIEKEGGWVLVNDPDDAGGLTFAGISKRANPEWPGWHYIDRGDSLNPPTPRLRAAVESRYRERYWNPLMLDMVKSPLVAETLMSSAVLTGPKVAARLMQAILGVKADGKVGPKTLAALENFRVSPDGAFVALFGLARIDRFSRLVAKRPANRKFLRGWVNRVLHELE